MPHLSVSQLQARIVAAGQLPKLVDASSVADSRALEPVSSETSSRVKAAVAELIRGPAAAPSTQAVRQRSIHGSSSSGSSSAMEIASTTKVAPGAVVRLHEAPPSGSHRPHAAVLRLPSANGHGAEDVSCRVSGTMKHGRAEGVLLASEAAPGLELDYRPGGNYTSADVHHPLYSPLQYRLREPPDNMLDGSDPFEDRGALLLTNASQRPGGSRRAAAAAGVHTVRPPPQRGGRMLRRRLRRREAEERAPW